MERDRLKPRLGHHREIAGHAFGGYRAVRQTADEGDATRAEVNQMLGCQTPPGRVVVRGKRENIGAVVDPPQHLHRRDAGALDVL